MSKSKITGLFINDPTYKLLILLASSSSRSLPAFLFTRSFRVDLDGNGIGLEVETFHELFREASDNGGTDRKQKKYPFSVYSYDWRYGANEPGPKLEVLRREEHLKVTHQERMTFVEISAQLRQEIWEMFATEPDKYQKAQSTLCNLIVHSLPMPYTEPLWETTSLACRDVISSTLLPFLLTSPVSSRFERNFFTEDSYFLLVFHLTNLGFVFDDVRWHLLFDDLQSSDARTFFRIHEGMSYILNVSTSEQRNQRLINPSELDFPRNPLFTSLVGFTIAHITWKSSALDIWEHCESWRSWWGANAQSRGTLLEQVAYALIYPESIDVDALTSYLPHRFILALAVGLNRSGHLAMSSTLLNSGLHIETSERRSYVYGLLFAELLKTLTLLDQAHEALLLGVDYLNETSNNNMHVSIATADAYIALGIYKGAQEMLQQILSDPLLGSFERICSVLRLNKVWRRCPDTMGNSSFAANLAQVVNSIRQEDSDIQEDYMTELQATVYHVKQPGESVPSGLRKVIEDTLELYQQDDVMLQNKRSVLRMLVETNSATVDPYVSHDGKENYGHVHSNPVIVSDPRTSSKIFERVPLQTKTLTKGVHDAWRKRSLLSLDGTGARGYWSLLVLKKLEDLIRIEEHRQRLLKNFVGHKSQTSYHDHLSIEDVQLRNYFDLICSTHTESLIALMLGKLRLKIERCLFEYKNFLWKVLRRPGLSPVPVTREPLQPGYDAHAMKEAIKNLTIEVDGDGLMRTMPESCAVSVVIINAQTKGEVSSQRPHIIRSYNNSKGLFPTYTTHGSIQTDSRLANELETWEVVQAAITASPYIKDTTSPLMRSQKTTNIDPLDTHFGASSNPTYIGYDELKSMYGSEGVGFIVSVGVAHRLECVSDFNEPTQVDPPIGSEDKNAVEMPIEDQLLDFYWRFSDSKGIDVGKNEWGPSALEEIQKAFDEWASDSGNDVRLRQCARELVRRRRLRKIDLTRWRQFEAKESLKDESKRWKDSFDSWARSIRPVKEMELQRSPPSFIRPRTYRKHLGDQGSAKPSVLGKEPAKPLRNESDIDESEETAEGNGKYRRS